MPEPRSARISRRQLLGGAAWGFAGAAVAQQPPEATLSLPAITPVARRSTVALVRGQERRKLIHDALAAIDDELRPALKRKKYVLIKPNLTSVTNQIASTHADTLRGILDYLAPRFKGPVLIAEAASGHTQTGYENFRYGPLIAEFRPRPLSLIDLNEEARAVTVPLIDANLHPMPVRLAARLLDPDAFILCAAILKTHNTVVATLAVKNMAMGAPLHSRKGETPRWHDKQRYHCGVHQINYNLLLTAQKLAPFWGAAIIDGYEAMEGDGPVSGTPVPSRLAIASTDYVAADRVGVEAMGVDANWVGYLRYCEQVGLGNYDLAKIGLRGESLAAVRRKFRLHRDIDRQLRWTGTLAGERRL